MAQRTNSPISDDAPWEEPEFEAPNTVREKTDWEKIGTSGKYPAIQTYIDGRKEHYRRYLPDGSAITDLPDEEIGKAWKNAIIIISELEAFEAIVLGQVAMAEPIKDAHAPVA
jgi:hypothetical protein